MMARARRILTYSTALVGLFAVLYAVAKLLSLLLTALLLSSSVNGGDTRQQLSLYLATLIVGLPLWLWSTTAANRWAKRNIGERDAGERRLFLAIIFAASSVIALFALQSLLRSVLALPAAPETAPYWQGAITAGSQFLVYGAAWLYYAQAGWAERRPGAADRTHDLAVYVLAGTALACLVNGLYQALQRIVGALVVNGWQGSIDWLPWSSILAWILAGGAIWSTICRYDLRRGGRRPVRVRYLYLVLCCAVPSALGGAVSGLYEMLRRLFGYHADFGFLRDVVPTVLIGAAVWLYHWHVVRAQGALENGEPLPGGSIAWPRRPGVALLTLLGHSIAVPGAISLLWLCLDALLNQGLRGSGWWNDRLSAASLR